MCGSFNFSETFFNTYINIFSIKTKLHIRMFVMIIVLSTVISFCDLWTSSQVI